MPDELKQILCDLIERHGRELVHEPKRLEGMLNDACAGQHRGARRVLVDAVQERVVEELLALRPSEQVEVVVGRAQQRLVENLAIASDSALWAIQAWAVALHVGGSMVPVPDFGQPTITLLSDEPDTDSSAPITVPTHPTPSPVRSGNLAAKVRNAQADTAAKHAQARQLISQKYDYAGAVTVLETIPEPLRDRGFYSDCVANRDRVVAIREQITHYAQAKQYLAAVPLADELLRLQPNRADVQQARSKLVAKVNEAQQLAATTHAIARKQANEEYDFVAAVQMLESIPQQFRDFSLLQEYAAKRDRVAELDQRITTAVDTHRLHELRPLVRELLGLQPHRDDLCELLDALPIPPAAEPLVAPYTDKQVFAARREWAIELGQSEEFEGLLSQKFVLIPAGEFDMGSTDSKDEQPIHRVRITQPMWVGMTPVTQAQYQVVMGRNPSNFKGNNRRPVDQVSWFDAIDFCNKLSQRVGRQRCYGIRSSDVQRLDGSGFRLPTEAEWEYFCRAGGCRYRFSFGSDETFLTDYGWYGTNSGSATHPVGKKKPNAFGLHDVHGNVWEWCEDWYQEAYYQTSPPDDPQGPKQNCEYRVLRGGSWSNSSSYSCCAYRDKESPNDRRYDVGFRVLCKLLAHTT